MPYEVVDKSEDCPAEEPYAVVKQGTTEVLGCHKDRKSAEDQIADLMAQEKDIKPGDDGDEYTSNSADTAVELPKWQGTIVVEGVKTGDSRMFKEGSITWAETPLPLRWNKEDSHGGEPKTVAVNVGRIDKVWREGNKIIGSGVFNTDEVDGTRAYKLVKGKFLRGISVDVDDISDADVELIWPDSGPESKESDDLLDSIFSTPECVTFHAGRIRASTLCDIPAFVEAEIALVDEDAYQEITSALTAAGVPKHSTATTDAPWDAGAQQKRLESPLTKAMMDDMFAWIDESMKNEDGTYPKGAGKFPHHVVGGNGRPGAANLTACSAGIGALHGARTETTIPDADKRSVYNHLASHLRDGNKTPPEFASKPGLSLVSALVAHGAPDWTPPREWFADPKLSLPTGLTVTDDGRVYGHAAKWGDCHVGHPGACVTPPREDAYPYFTTGELVCDDGSVVSVGQITLDTNHAPLNMRSEAASQHYDNTGTAVADVTVGSDDYGLWVAGAIRPNASAASVRELRASGQLSGDWRRIGGQLRLVALLAVNVPGFPVPSMSARVASGQQLSLVAAGHISLRPKDLEAYYEQRALRTIADRLYARVHRYDKKE
jgi:hypothetical protein